MASLLDNFLSNSLPQPKAYVEYLKLKVLRALERDIGLLVRGRKDLETVLRLLRIPYLTSNPKFLYGLNCLIQPDFRLECSTTNSEVDCFVLVESNASHVYTLSDVGPRRLISDQTVREVLGSDDAWKELVARRTGFQWKESLSQVLQEILDDSRTEANCRKLAHKRLVQLAKEDTVAPPSIFIRFVDEKQPQRIRDVAKCAESGGFCSVYKANLGSLPTCLRVLHQSLASDLPKMHKTFFTELVIWRQLRHPNITPLLGASFDIFPDQCCFLQPWFENGSLKDFLKKETNLDKVHIVRQIVDALAYLHDFVPPVVHRDIKAANILVNRKGRCLLSDFGLSNVINSQEISTMRGTLYWMPPEAFHEEPLDSDGRPRDIYSLGCTIYEILTKSDPKLVMLSVIRGQSPEIPEQHWSSEEMFLWGIAMDCLAISPDQRPDIFAVNEELQLIPSPLRLSLQVDPTKGPLQITPLVSTRTPRLLPQSTSRSISDKPKGSRVDLSREPPAYTSLFPEGSSTSDLSLTESRSRQVEGSNLRSNDNCFPIDGYPISWHARAMYD